MIPTRGPRRIVIDTALRVFVGTSDPRTTNSLITTESVDGPENIFHFGVGPCQSPPA